MSERSNEQAFQRGEENGFHTDKQDETSVPGLGASHDGTIQSASTRIEDEVVSTPTAEVEGWEVKSSNKITTLSDVINTMNETMRATTSVHRDVDGIGDADGEKEYPKVELCRRTPDGGAVPVDESELKATDLQCKLREAAALVSSLSQQGKMAWAEEKRLEGNRLFSAGQYRQAMDVYTTCLVSIDYKSTPTTAHEGHPSDNEQSARACTSDEHSTHTIDDVAPPYDTPSGVSVRHHRERIEKEVQLPVLLNLAACALKLGQYAKAEQFCTIALNDLPVSRCGEQSVKTWYRRGKARMHMGSYHLADVDYRAALDVASTDEERAAVERDRKKLAGLVRAAESNRRKYKKAMKSVFGSTGEKQVGSLNGGDDLVVPSSGLYGDISTRKGRKYSLLTSETAIRSDRNTNHSGATLNSYSDKAALENEERGHMSVIAEFGIVGWAVSIVSGCLRRVFVKWLPEALNKEREEDDVLPSSRKEKRS